MFSSTSITSVAIHSCYSLSNQYISNHGLGLQPEPDPCSHLILVICLHINVGQSPYTHHLHCYYLTQVNVTSHSDYTVAPRLTSLTSLPTCFTPKLTGDPPACMTSTVSCHSTDYNPPMPSHCWKDKAHESRDHVYFAQYCISSRIWKRATVQKYWLKNSNNAPKAACSRLYWPTENKVSS